MSTGHAVSRREFVRAVGGAALAAAVVTAGPALAFASSNSRWYYLSGISIECEASATTGSGSAYGTAITSSGVWAALGSYVVLYDDSGAAKGSNRVYRSGYSCLAEVACGASAGRSYRSLAVSYVYNTSTQVYEDNFYDPVWSPYTTARTLDEPYQVNSWGATYGPVTGLRTWGFLPDLVAVEGEGGVFGYVYREQFVPPQAANPEEAAAFFSEPQVLYAPVYDCEGAEQVDVFAVQYGG